MLAIFMLACLSDVSVLRAQERKIEPVKEDDKQVLKALLEEVRQLRLALQRSNAVSHRLQITVERLRLQQARVDSLTRSLDNVRVRVTDLKSARPQIESRRSLAKADSTEYGIGKGAFRNCCLMQISKSRWTHTFSGER